MPSALLQVDGESHVLHTEEEAMGTRLVMDTLSCLIAKETDPSTLVALSPGKLVRQLVQNGEHIELGQAFAELEVMKMMMPLLCPAAGVIHFEVGPGVLAVCAAKDASCCSLACTSATAIADCCSQPSRSMKVRH